MVTAELPALLRGVDRPGGFATSGSVVLFAPAVIVAGVGRLALPLPAEQAERLIAVAAPAPYGRDEATLVDPAVRRCWQIAPASVNLQGKLWAETLERIVGRAAEGLGIVGTVSATFYKLLLYGPGSFFVSHRDTEKEPGMVATLVVVLPSEYGGGALIVRHKGREEHIVLRPDDPAEVAFAAFYADCVHEIRPLTEGYRLTLVYNLVRTGASGSAEPPDYDSKQGRVGAALRRWRDSGDAPLKLVYPLEHAYTPAELGFAALKGADAAVAGVMEAAAREADCDIHAALLTIEEAGPADHTGSGGWGDDDDEFEVVEVSERMVSLSEWRRPDGGAVALSELPVVEDEFSPPDICEAMEPDEEHFSEATGNEGASFERTYRRAALVVWPRDWFFDVVNQAGLGAALGYLEDMAGRWVASGGDADSPALAQAEALARRILETWPQPEPYRRNQVGAAARMLTVLATLSDTGGIAMFLSDVTASGFYGKDDNGAILAALALLPGQLRARLLETVVGGSGRLHWAACADLLRRAVVVREAADLLGAAERLVEALPDDSAPVVSDGFTTRMQRPDAAFVVDLVAGLSAVDAGLADRAVTHILACRKTYGPSGVLVPAAVMLVSAGGDGPAVERLRRECVAYLQERVAVALEPPADWRRESRVGCDCPNCAALARFLDHPAQRVWVLKAKAGDRGHVEGTIRSAGVDVDTATERRGSPHGLVCTKNQASYDRLAEQRAVDLESLGRLGGG